MKTITLFSILALFGISATGQNLIGYSEKDIRKYMRENRKDMNFNNVINTKFHYLKYSDNGDRQTTLFFLNHDSVCMGVRMICDVSIRDEKVKEFDSIYKKSGDNRWINEKDGKNYLIEIKDEKWSCIVSIEPYK
jgi:hypothetical protein